MTDVVLLAHGSPDARHARDLNQLVRRVAAYDPALDVRAAYLDHHAPAVGEIGAALREGRTRVGHPSSPHPASASRIRLDGPVAHGEPIVLVPVLLKRAFHARVDIPRARDELEHSAGRPVLATQALGPHPLLAAAIGELLNQRSECRVLVYLAGSSRREAVDELLDTVTDALSPERAYAFATLDEYLPLSAAIRTLGRADGVVGVSAMIAEGVLRDRMITRCAEYGIPFADGALAHTDALARLVLRRVAERVRDADDEASVD